MIVYPEFGRPDEDALEAYTVNAMQSLSGPDRPGIARGRLITGPAGSGKTPLLNRIASGVRSKRTVSQVVEGSFRDGQYIPRVREDRSYGRIVDQLATTVAWVPAIGFYAQLIHAGIALWDLFTPGNNAPNEDAGPFQFKKALRHVAQSQADLGVTVCCFDDVHQSHGPWFEVVVEGLLREAAEGLPLWFFLTMATSPAVAPTTGQTGAGLLLTTARSATREELLLEWPLRPCTRDDVVRWVAADEALTDDLFATTSGSPSYLVELWSELVSRDMIRPEGGCWALTGASSTTGVVDDVLESLLIGSDDRTLLRDIIGCAALEGRSFTAAAVARTIGIEVADLIQLVSVRDRATTERIFSQITPATVSGPGPTRRELERYRFISLFIWQASKRVLPRLKRQALARRLVDELAELYRYDEWLVAETLAQLCRGVDEKRSRRYEKVARYQADYSTASFTIAGLIELSSRVEGPEALFVCQSLQATLGTVLHRYHPQELVHAYQVALRLATDERSVPDQVDAGTGYAAVLGELQDYTGAELRLEEAIKLARQVDYSEGLAAALCHLAKVHCLTDSRRSARREALEALRLSRRADSATECTALGVLGDALSASPLRACVVLEAAVRCHRRSAADYGLIKDLQSLGQVEMQLRNYGKARESLSESLDLARQLRFTHAVSRGLPLLAGALGMHGDVDAAREVLLEAIPLQEEGETAWGLRFRIRLRRALSFNQGGQSRDLNFWRSSSSMALPYPWSGGKQLQHYLKVWRIRFA